MDKNLLLMDWIQNQVTTHYNTDIALVLLYGSVINGTNNDTSDLDCYFIPKTERALKFSQTFIVDGIGYDIFPMHWETVESIANLDHRLLPCLWNSKIIFSHSDADVTRFEKLRNIMLRNLQNDALVSIRVNQKFAEANNLYQDLEQSSHRGNARKLAGQILMILAECVALKNSTYFQYGLKKQLHDLKTFDHIPEHFIETYLQIIKTTTADSIKDLTAQMMITTQDYYNIENIAREPSETPLEFVTDFQILADMYAEICSTFNKIYACEKKNDFFLCFVSSVCLQHELDSISQMFKIPPYDLLSSFDSSDLRKVSKQAKKIEEEIIKMVTDSGSHINTFRTMKEFCS